MRNAGYWFANGRAQRHTPAVPSHSPGAVRPYRWGGVSDTPAPRIGVWPFSQAHRRVFPSDASNAGDRQIPYLHLRGIWSGFAGAGRQSDSVNSRSCRAPTAGDRVARRIPGAASKACFSAPRRRSWLGLPQVNAQSTTATKALSREKGAKLTNRERLAGGGRWPGGRRERVGCIGADAVVPFCRSGSGADGRCANAVENPPAGGSRALSSDGLEPFRAAEKVRDPPRTVDSR